MRKIFIMLLAIVLFAFNFGMAQNLSHESVSNQETSSVYEDQSLPLVKFDKGAKTVLFEQSDMITHPGGGFNGADLSMFENTTLGNTSFGGGMNFTSGYSIADDFEVPMGEVWLVNSFVFYAYQTGSTTTSTLTDVRIRIYNSDPNSGPTPLHDFFSQNNLTETNWTGIYRASETDAMNSTRPIMYAKCDINTLTLPAGTYWVEVSMLGSLSSGPWMVPITILGSTNTGNAYQFNSTAWSLWVDGGSANPFGMPFSVLGTIDGTTSINETEVKISVYPNPSSGLYNIEANENYAIEIIDITGRIVLSTQMNNNAATVDISSNQAGVYFLRLNGKESTAVYKLFKN